MGSGDALRSLRQSAGVSQLALSRASGVGLRSLCRWEAHGLERVAVLDLVRLAWALGVAPSELVPALSRRPRGGGGLVVEADQARAQAYAEAGR